MEPPIADVDGDGIPDFIAGKRQFSHKDDLLDPDAYSPPYLYWYKTVRDPKAPGGARLVPELIHNDTGAGDNLLAGGSEWRWGDRYRGRHQARTLHLLGQAGKGSQMKIGAMGRRVRGGVDHLLSFPVA